MISLSEADRYVLEWKLKGAKFEIAGGVWKKKPVLHDIDLVVETRHLENVAETVKANKPPVPVELYHTNAVNFPKLLHALRATTYEAISQRLMAGLSFRKVRI